MKKGRKRRAKEKKSNINLNIQRVYVKKYQQNQIKVDLTANLGQLEGLDDFDRQLLEDFIYENNLIDQETDIYFDLDLEDEEIINGLEIENEENNDTQEVETDNSYALKTRIEETSELQEQDDEVISNDQKIENEENNDSLKKENENNYTIKLKVEEAEDLFEKKDELIIFKSNSKIKNETSLKANQFFVDLLGVNILLTLDTEQLIYIKASNGAFHKNSIPLSFPINSIVTFVENLIRKL